jgi:uncharacterized protein YaaQ
MKMIVCILQDSDKDEVSKALNEAGFKLTLLPSTGAYFRRGNATLMIGVEKEKVEQVIELIRTHVKDPSEPGVKRATLFVLNVEEFRQV